jgi:hypothetical protein
VSSPSSQPDVRRNPEEETLSPLLDSAFGFFVWAIHLLSVYVAEALACQLGLGVAGPGTQATFIALLALVTIAASAVVVLHGFRRYRQQHGVQKQRFRMSVTVGADAIAALGILWQLFALFLVPVCV